MKPTIGRIVITPADPRDNNGAEVAPAVITRVWGQAADGSWTVNVRVLLDGTETPWKTSISLYDTEEAGLAAGKAAHFAWWPPRVEGPMQTLHIPATATATAVAVPANLIVTEGSATVS